MTPEQAGYLADRNKALGRLGWLGVTEDDYDACHRELTASLGTRPARGDTYWKLANRMVIAHAGDYWTIKQIRHGMAVHLMQEGRPWHEMKRLSLENELRELKQKIKEMELGGQVEAWTDTCCEAGRALDRRRFNVDVALTTTPLPPPDCTGGFCTCSWQLVLDF